MSGRTFGLQSSWDDVFKILLPESPAKSRQKAIGIADSMNQQFEEFLNRFVVTATNDDGDITFDAAGTYTFNGDVNVAGNITLVTGGLIRTAASGTRVEMDSSSDDRITFWPGGGETSGSRIVVVAGGSPETYTTQIYSATKASGDAENRHGTLLQLLSDGSAGISYFSSGSGPAVVDPHFGVGMALRADDGTASVPGYSFTLDIDTGMYLSSTGELAFTTAGVKRLVINATGLNVQDGSASAPTYSFDSDANTGMYWISADVLAFAAGGNERLRVGASYVDTNGATTGSVSLRANAAGTAAGPGYSFAGDANTGMYRVSADTIGFATGGAVRLTIEDGWVTGKVPFSGLPGSVSAPGYVFAGDADTGMYRHATAVIAFACAGVRQFSVGAAAFSAPSIYAATTGNAANVNVHTDGHVRRSTSTIKVKKSVQAYHDSILFDQLIPVTFDSKIDDGRSFFGFIAEWTHDVAPEFTDHQMDQISDRAILAATVARVQSLERRMSDTMTP